MSTDQDHERFIRNAEECCRMAERSIRHEDRLGWIRLAEKWLSLTGNVGNVRDAQFSLPEAEHRTLRH
jgi:hypothetical protein